MKPSDFFSGESAVIIRRMLYRTQAFIMEGENFTTEQSTLKTADGARLKHGSDFQYIREIAYSRGPC